MVPRGSFAKAFGPGLLFAGSSIGASHLVQSMRSGAVYGLSLIVVIVLANVVKYPAFAFGPHYAAATGTSLLEGYRRQGRAMLYVFLALAMATLFTATAGVSVVTAGLAIALFGLPLDPWTASACILGTCMALIAVGQFRWIDRINKLAVALLTVGTLIASIVVLPRIDFSGPLLPTAAMLGDPATFFFVVALVGWMPTAIDVSVWHSLWSVARRHDTGYAPTLREARWDFDIGYVGTAVLALCFVALGAGVVHGTDTQIPTGAAAFAEVVIGLYADALGEWSRPVLGGSAFLVMFSTTLTVLDGAPRSLTALLARLRGPEEPGRDAAAEDGRWQFIGLGCLLSVVALIMLRELAASLPRFIDLATTLAVLTAPFLAWLNHRVVFADDIPPELRPSPAMRVTSAVMIVIMGAFAATYLIVRFVL